MSHRSEMANERAAGARLARTAGASAAGHGLARGILRSLMAVLMALGLVAAGAAAAGASTASAAGPGHCTRTVKGAHHGDLVASSGVLCLDGAAVTGAVSVRAGAGLDVTASTISGGVTTTRARSVQICGSTIIGPLNVSKTAGAVTVGTGKAACRGDVGHASLEISGSGKQVQVTGLRQQGPVTLSGNTAGVVLSGGSVSGDVALSGNQGHAPVVISANTVTGGLACTDNQPAPGDKNQPNTVSGTASGQCQTLVPAPPRRQALPPIPQDESSTLPNLNYGQAVGHFTSAGHDQLAYAQDGQLKIADVAKFGGVVHSIPTDLRAIPNTGDIVGEPWENDCFVSSWCGTLQSNGATYGMTRVKVAASASSLYMAGATWDESNPESYQLHLYKLAHDGSCATTSCVEREVSLPNIFDAFGRRNLIVVTSLATGVVGGRTLIAVGLSDFGIDIFDGNLNYVGNIQDMGTGDGTQTPITALAFGPPSGPGQGGLLAAGVESPGSTMFTWRLNPDGTEQSGSVDKGDFSNVLMAATFAQIDGQTVAAFTRSDGDVILRPLGDGGSFLGDIPIGQRIGQPTGLTAVTPWNGSPGTQELVVGKLDGTTDQVLQWVNGALTPVPIGQGGATEVTHAQVYNWWPGYSAGRLRVADNSAGPVTVAIASRPDVGYGCWLNAAVTGPPAVPAFPVSDTRLAAGAASPDYFIGALTAGPDGSCASATLDSKGERAAYVVITPVGDSADEHIVKLTLTPDAKAGLSIASQVGGYLTADLKQVSTTPGSAGTWQLDVTGGTAPAASTAPTVTGHRLTAKIDPVNYVPPTSPAADDPCRPVYRFDVTGAQWKNVTSPGQVSAQLPPMTAQGSTDGGQTWQDLGQLMPATTPTVGADGTVTLGPASFFFQNAAGTAAAPGVDPAEAECPTTGNQPVTEVRVVSGALASSPVTLADLAAPPLNGGSGATPIQGVTAVPDGNGGAAAVLRADGVDQAGLTLQLTPTGSGAIPTSDPRYNLVYYRDDVTKALVTGLYQPGDYAGYTGVEPYAADGSSGQPNRNYLTTTSTAPGHLDPLLNDTGTVTAIPGSSFAVAASSNPLTRTGANITGGIGLTGCTSSPNGACTLAVPSSTTPALYQAGGPGSGPLTGLLLSASAITGRVSLPLQTGTANVHELGSALLDVTAGQAQLTDASQFFPSDTVDTALVTAGQLVPVLSVPVGP